MEGNGVRVDFLGIPSAQSTGNGGQESNGSPEPRLTRACRRPPIASARSSLRLLTAPEAQRSGARAVEGVGEGVYPRAALYAVAGEMWRSCRVTGVGGLRRAPWERGRVARAGPEEHQAGRAEQSTGADRANGSFYPCGSPYMARRLTASVRWPARRGVSGRWSPRAAGCLGGRRDVALGPDIGDLHGAAGRPGGRGAVAQAQGPPPHRTTHWSRPRQWQPVP